MKITQIIKFAIDAHDKVNHKYDNSSYAVHLSLVATTATVYMPDVSYQETEIIIAACYLHDTIDDCRLTFNDIKEVAGTEVAEIVYALTNEKGKSRKERANFEYYAGIRSTKFAAFVKLCDRAANISYSLESGSRMFDCYKKEHADFIHNVATPEHQREYADLLDLMEQMLKHQ